MSDKPPKEQVEFEEFLRDVGAKYNCPMCDHNSWAMNFKTKEMNVSLQIAGTANHIVGRWFICNNCGFIRVHSEHNFNEWKKNKGNGND